MTTTSSLGWIASLCAAFTWSFSVLIFRQWGVGRSPIWLNLFKGSVALLFFGLTTVVSGGLGIVSSKSVLVLAISGIVGVFIGDSAFFAALLRIGGTLTSTLQCLAPSLTAILAWFFLGEALTGAQIFGLLVTSVCLALLVLLESRSKRKAGDGFIKERRVFTVGVSLALLAALSQAAGAVISRPVLDGMSPLLSASLRLWAPVLLLLIWQIFKNKGFLFTLRDLTEGRGIIPMAVASFAGTFVGLILMMYGMTHSPLGVALALNSTYPIWILLGEYVTGRSDMNIIQGALVLGSVAGIWLMI